MIRATENTLAIRTERFTRLFTFSRNRPGTIGVRVERTAGVAAEELTSEGAPYFEFVIAGQVVRASDPFWVFRSHTFREMGNGGTEVALVFEGAAHPVAGLEVTVVQQIFTDTTLVREKLTLSALGPRVFRLHLLDGLLHFRFPQYRIAGAECASVAATEIRIASWEAEPTSFHRPGQEDTPVFNHMFHPRIERPDSPAAGPVWAKGPIQILEAGEIAWLTAYEHASQDDTRGLLKKAGSVTGKRLVDTGQEIEGVFDFVLEDRDFWFLGIRRQSSESGIDISVDILRGGYLDGEEIDAAHPYSTVWVATGFLPGGGFEAAKAMVRDYLLNRICERPASRRPEFYYNTWGMQRAQPPGQLRDVLTYERIFREIRHATELGVDLFVLDDGWEEAQGVWTPHPQRLPEGLAPIRQEVERHGMKLGVWLSPMGIDAAAQRYREHPEWVVKDSTGNPIRGQWGHPVFDFVSGFRELFIEDCKRLIDDGVRFFKWDAINSFYSTLPGLRHGSSEHTADEIRARYEYLLPLHVVEAMAALTDYESDLVIEIDLTEARRALAGLAVLSQGKFFWMNNGASGYGDYSAFRAKSMRTIPNLYAGIVPLELFTYANYPHNQAGSSDCNISTSLIAGHGFWGDLDLMTVEERSTVRRQVERAKQVLPHVIEVNPQVLGRVGDSPEIYTQVDPARAVGQVIAFSGEAIPHTHRVPLDASALLGVVGHPFHAVGNTLLLDFAFPVANSTHAAFVLPNDGTDVSVLSSTGRLDDLRLITTGLAYVAVEPGVQRIRWARSRSQPVWFADRPIEARSDHAGNDFWLEVTVRFGGTRVEIRGG